MIWLERILLVGLGVSVIGYTFWLYAQLHP